MNVGTSPPPSENRKICSGKVLQGTRVSLYFLIHVLLSVPGYLGCFENKGNIAEDTFQELQLPDMSIDKCRIYCKGLNFTIANLQNGSWCFCSHDVNENELLDDSKCRRTCNGNSQQICGDGYTFSTYDGKAYSRKK